MKQEISWINLTKAICMISVYILHSEAYYGINDISYGYFLQPFYVNVFFYVSGYLFFKKQLQTVKSYCFTSFKENIQTIIFRLVIPTIIFASIIYLPKLFFHSKDISITQYFYNVFGGISFWFTSTIIVSQIILLCLLFLKKKTVFPYFISSILLFIFAIYLSDIDKTPFPWFYKSGIGATLFLTLGGLYQQYEQKIDKKIGVFSGILLIFIYLGCMLYDINNNSFQYAMMSMKYNIQGLLISILGIDVIVFICKQLPKLNVIEYIGRNSIVFYFFSGALPASIGLVFQKIFPEKTYIITLTVALLSICIGYLLTYVVVKYLPWLTDFRKLKNNDKTKNIRLGLRMRTGIRK